MASILPYAGYWTSHAHGDRHVLHAQAFTWPCLPVKSHSLSSVLITSVETLPDPADLDTVKQRRVGYAASSFNPTATERSGLHVSSRRTRSSRCWSRISVDCFSVKRFATASEVSSAVNSSSTVASALGRRTACNGGSWSWELPYSRLTLNVSTEPPNTLRENISPYAGLQGPGSRQLIWFTSHHA